jgi:hypothetical protein
MKMSTYAIARFPTPIFNTSHSSSFFSFKNEFGLMKNIEMIAFPGSKFSIQKEISSTIFQITTCEYPSKTPLYIDRRFLQEASFNTLERKKCLPPSSILLTSMLSLLGTRYFWGGNWAQGIPEMVHLYPHLLTSIDLDDILCKGVDCSGLLYQVTNGFTPRNTNQLIHYGREFAVNFPSLQQLQENIKPLDMLVWKGHVVFALSQNEVIESLHKEGVIVTPLKERYPQILNRVRLENETLYFRRWHPDFLNDNKNTQP